MSRYSREEGGGRLARETRMAGGRGDGEHQVLGEMLHESRDLVQRAKAGDCDAFAALMARHEKAVLGLAWRMLGNLEDARDVAQEVFMRLYRHLDKLDPDRDAAPWLRAITVNACQDARERGRRHAASSLDDPDRPLGPLEIAHPSDLHESFAHGQEVRRTLKALDALPAKERAALVLRDVEGLSTQEVARLLDSTQTTVRSQVSRARLHLRRALGVGGTP
jgi:RNA polymerase sigma-70 factor, ECF subfamily